MIFSEGTPHPLPSWLYLLLAVLAGALGLAASGVSAFLFILGLEQTEPNETARQALTAIGLLLVAAELLAFFLPTLLTGRGFLKWRLLLGLFGIALVTFQIATVTVTQRTLVAATDLSAQANTAQAAEIRAQIESLRQNATQLRTLAGNYASSSAHSQRNRAPAVIQQAMEIEAQIPPLSAKLAQLDTAARPTLTSVFESAQEKTLFLGARAALIAFTGILMFSLSGVLLRTYLTRRTEQRELPQPTATQPPVETPAPHAVKAASLPTFADEPAVDLFAPRDEPFAPPRHLQPAPPAAETLSTLFKAQGKPVPIDEYDAPVTEPTPPETPDAIDPSVEEPPEALEPELAIEPNPEIPKPFVPPYVPPRPNPDVVIATINNQ